MRWLWLCLVLVATVASGQRLTTFSWDAGANWPAGTTVDLCGNGDICLTGLASTQATLDLPVHPGEVIQGRARAHALDGRISEWATVDQTWPLPVIGLWAQYKQENIHNQENIPMAATITGSASTYDSNSTTFSTSVTVPSDATLAVLLIAGFKSGTFNWLNPSDLTLGGTAFTNVVDSDNQTAGEQTWLGYMANPATGSQTFAKASGVSISEGLIYTIVYLKDVAASPIQASGSNGTSGGSITGLSTDANAITIGVVGRYQTSTDNMTDTGNGFTKINARLYNNAYQNVSYKANSSSFSYLNAYYSSASAVVIAGTAASTSLIYPHPTSRFSQLLVR